MAYRGRADRASLDRLGRALTGSARSSTMVEVDVAPEQIDVLRLVASGTRAPGIVEVAQIVGAELDRLPPPERRRRGPRRPQFDRAGIEEEATLHVLSPESVRRSLRRPEGHHVSDLSTDRSRPSARGP